VPFNGSGVFTRLKNWVSEAAQNINILPDHMDTDTNDIAAGLSMCITKDGQQAITADIPWNGFRITGLGGLTSTGTAAVTGNWQFPATALGVTAVYGTTGTQFATLDYVLNQAMNVQLPAQAGKADNVLTTDGTNGSWTTALKATAIRFKDGTDATKLLAFDLSGLTTATTRTVAWPDKSGTVALTSDTGMPAPLAVITPTASATVDLLTIFSSNYDFYEIHLEGIAPASGNPNISIRVANSGVVDTATHYAQRSAWTGTITPNANTSFTGGSIDSGLKSSTSIIRFLNANDALGLKGLIMEEFFYDSINYNANLTIGIYTQAAAVSGLRFLWSGGQNFAAQGKIRVYGFKNS